MLVRRMPLRDRPQGALDWALPGPAVDTVVPTKHALDVAVENGVPIAVAERKDGAGGRAADPRQGDKRVEFARHLPVMTVPHQDGGPVKIAGPGVVAESRPQPEHVVEGRVRESRESRKPCHESLVVPDDDTDPGLLQHDFGHPHAVGCGVALPGQMLAPVARMPVDQPPGDRREVSAHRCAPVVRSRASPSPAQSPRAPGPERCRPGGCAQRPIPPGSIPRTRRSR